MSQKKIQEKTKVKESETEQLKKEFNSLKESLNKYQSTKKVLNKGK